ncbi:hypothetical protein JB92DRAFT_3013422 [Gautieria morchelliformis]|nr:hypothetical protein JB92DRAFT_3013422 [Gautieria morchelliformis]
MTALRVLFMLLPYEEFSKINVPNSPCPSKQQPQLSPRSPLVFPPHNTDRGRFPLAGHALGGAIS